MNIIKKNQPKTTLSTKMLMLNRRGSWRPTKYISMGISNHQGATKVSNIQRSLSQDRKEISILRLEQISKYQTEF